MSGTKDPFEVLVIENDLGAFAELSGKPVAPSLDRAPSVMGAVTARLHGFDLQDQPLIADLPHLPGETLPARTTVPLLSRQVGSSVIVLFEEGDVRRPIVVGVLQEQRPTADLAAAPPQLVSVEAEGDRLVVSAEREIVLRCGDSSITLTRAGKVIIKGSYIISRSTGVNKIKGAAVDIN